MTKAYSYLRFSTPEQMQGDSFRRQTQFAERYAQQHGLELDDTFRDLGVSAYQGSGRREAAMAQQPSDWATDAMRDRQLGDLANWSRHFVDLILTEHTVDALAAQGWSAGDTDLLRAS